MASSKGRIRQLPELPEVEHVCRNLQQLVVGKTIGCVEVRLPRIICYPSIQEFCAQLQGLTIQGVRRRGKYLIFSIPPFELISHLRMEGQYRLAISEEEQPHTHVVFHFTDGTELRYRDVRQFGTMHLTDRPENYPIGLQTLGPEPFDESLNASYFLQIAGRRKLSVKALLLQQDVIAGIGNIYADEALFLAGIHPAASCWQLKKKDWQRLLVSVREILQMAIEAGGSTIRSYADGYGRHGGFQIQLQVYQREGQPCQHCGREIVKIRLAGRGTHFCPKCQKIPRVQSDSQSVQRRKEA